MKEIRWFKSKIPLCSFNDLKQEHDNLKNEFE